jgi:hypothetical protein
VNGLFGRWCFYFIACRKRISKHSHELCFVRVGFAARYWGVNINKIRDEHNFGRPNESSIFQSHFHRLLLDRFALGSSPYGPDAPRPYIRALCAP